MEMLDEQYLGKVKSYTVRFNPVITDNNMAQKVPIERAQFKADSVAFTCVCAMETFIEDEGLEQFKHYLCKNKDKIANMLITNVINAFKSMKGVL